MNIMIIGGGNVGYYLAKTLLAEKQHIMIVEAERGRCERIASDFGENEVEVTCGDGTAVKSLEDAGIYGTDVLVAVTGRDQDNLAACQLAKSRYGVKQTVARVKNPKNIRVFEKLGVDSVISSTQRIAGVINQELDWVDVNRLLRERSCNVRLRNFTVEQGSWAEHKKLSELGLPKGLILVAVLRGDEAVIPGGKTELEAGDVAVVWGDSDDMEREFEMKARGGESE